MGNKIQISGNWQLSNGATLNGDNATTINTSGSHFISENQSTTGSVYLPLITSSLSDIRAGYFSNQDSLANITLALDSAGAKVLSVMLPNDTVMLGFSGSLPALWAKASNTTGSAILQYILSES